jgi:hypothetical protein
MSQIGDFMVVLTPCWRAFAPPPASGLNLPIPEDDASASETGKPSGFARFSLARRGYESGSRANTFRPAKYPSDTQPGAAVLSLALFRRR